MLKISLKITLFARFYITKSNACIYCNVVYESYPPVTISYSLNIIIVETPMYNKKQWEVSFLDFFVVFSNLKRASSWFSTYYLFNVLIIET